MKKITIYRKNGIDYSKTYTDIGLWLRENSNPFEYRSWNIFGMIYSGHPIQILFHKDEDCNLFKITFDDLYKIVTQKYETN